MTRRTPRDRCGFAFLPRDKAGRVRAVDPLRRFAEKCQFDARTGCVLWAGGKTQGRGNSAVYGSFWADGRRHFAHRWSAENIHGHAIGGLQVGHVCPHGPNTLCVQHVTPQTPAENMAEQIERLGPPGVRQTNAQRQYWLFVSLGIEPPPDAQDVPDDETPFHEPPDWLRPFLPQHEETQCPF